MDLSTFLERQRISEPEVVLGLEVNKIDEEEIDASLAHISSTHIGRPVDKKGKVQEIKWDRELDELSREKAAAEAQRGA